ncbi:unnamed protein product [Mycena citricolor]|uniref:SH3 domain-containing protein n=1 Tax=Mycena citricolor TaxID=2018698 RepID=A0AAD2Q0M0_9AGAR|nr:unnamed protein product [Mycena citricolor]CAK5275230.1 unnamed protein product [Mycena citricolor]
MSQMDFGPFRNYPFFLATQLLATLGWFLAFIFQAVATGQFGNRSVGSLWFAIFLQAALNIGVLLAITTDSLHPSRIQLTAFSVMATIFAVQGVQAGFFPPFTPRQNPEGALVGMGFGYLILAVVDLLWALYFSSDEDSVGMRLFTLVGAAPIAPPRGRTAVTNRMHTPSLSRHGSRASSKAKYRLGAGVSSDDVITTDLNGAIDVRRVTPPPSNHRLSRKSTSKSVASSMNRKSASVSFKEKEAYGSPSPTPAGIPLPASPIIPPVPTLPYGNGAADIEAGMVTRASSPTPLALPTPVLSEPSPAPSETFPKARALHSYTGSLDDPNELSFKKGEILEIEDQEGKWWQARKADGSYGIVPSNYLVMI